LVWGFSERRRRACGNCGKAGAVLRRLFQAAVEIIKKIVPQASFVDFHSCGSFHRFSFLVLFSFSLERISLVENRAESRYESDSRLL